MRGTGLDEETKTLTMNLTFIFRCFYNMWIEKIIWSWKEWWRSEIKRREQKSFLTWNDSETKSIWELKSSVLALVIESVWLDKTLSPEDKWVILLSHYAHNWILQIPITEFQEKLKHAKVMYHLDSPFEWSFPEWYAQFLENDISKIEREISALQDKMNTLLVSSREIQCFKWFINRFRYGMYHLHSYIWSAHKWWKQEELRKAIWVADKIVADIQFELAILLHKFWVTEILHPNYAGRSINGALGTIETMNVTPVIWLPNDADLTRY